MKQQQMLVVLAVLIGAILLGIWMRRGRREGFADTPECTYAEPKEGFFEFCANDLTNPFRCTTFTNLQEAKIACSGNDNCRGIVEANLGNRTVYQMRVGPGASAYNLNTMISDMLRWAGTPEKTYFITNLSECKPGKFASKTRGPNDPPQIESPIRGNMDMPGGPMPGGRGGLAPDSLDVGGRMISVPSNTLLAVRASETIFAKGAPGAPAESSPAPVGPGGPPPEQVARRQMTEQEFRALTLTQEEKDTIEGLPLPIQIKIVDAIRNNLNPAQALTNEEANIFRANRLARQA